MSGGTRGLGVIQRITSSGGTSLTLTDGTNTVADVGQITVSGGTVGGTSPNAILSISGGGAGILWNEITTTTAALVVNNGYVMNNSSRVVGTLPINAAQFSVIRVVGKGAGGWQIAQNAGQTIHFDANNTTTGTGGSLSSQSTFDCIDLLCITANTDFIVTSSIGNITGV